MEVERKPHAINLLRSTNLMDIPIQVKAHEALNFSRGVVRSRDIDGSSSEEMLEELRGQEGYYPPRL